MSHPFSLLLFNVGISKYPKRSLGENGGRAWAPTSKWVYVLWVSISRFKVGSSYLSRSCSSLFSTKSEDAGRLGMGPNEGGFGRQRSIFPIVSSIAGVREKRELERRGQILFSPLKGSYTSSFLLLALTFRLLAARSLLTQDVSKRGPKGRKERGEKWEEAERGPLIIETTVSEKYY